jgi:hypothetical protein
MAGGSRVYADGATALISTFFGLQSAPAGFQVGLLTAMPDEDIDASSLAGIEFSGGGYARVSVGVGAANWSVYGDGLIANDFSASFPQATSDWVGICSHWFLKMGSTDVMIAASPLSSPFRVLAGMIPRIGPGTLALSLHNDDDPVIN